MTETLFDAHLDARDFDARNGPEGLCGAILYGLPAAACAPANMLRAETLNALIGASDPRFPRHAGVLDLDLDTPQWRERLKEPTASWWPLCGMAREDGRRVLIHLHTADFAGLARAVSQLARRFRTARFLIDPFASGPAVKWQAGVCLADEENIWLTSRGLFGSASVWKTNFELEALHFVIGEIGAGKLLFASGLTQTQLREAPLTPADWLERIHFLDAAQRILILRENAVETLRASANYEPESGAGV